QHRRGRDVPESRRRRDGSRLDSAPLHAHARRGRTARRRRKRHPAHRRVRAAAGAGYLVRALSRYTVVKGSLLMLAAAGLLLSGCGSTKTVKQQPPLENPDGSLNVAIKVLKHGKQVIALVPVTINGKGPYTFALDTGA